MNLTPPPPTTPSFAKSAIPLSLIIKPSRWYLAVATLLHLLALAALSAAVLPTLIQFGLSLAVVASLMYNLHVSTLTQRITWHAENRWTLKAHRAPLQSNNEYIEARLTSVDFLSRWLVILSLKPEGRRTERVVIPFDSLTKDRYRLLRVRLRIEAHRLLNPQEPDL